VPTILNNAVRFRITDHNTLGDAAGGGKIRGSGVLEGGLEASGGVEASQASIVRLGKVYNAIEWSSNGVSEDLSGKDGMGLDDRGSGGNEASGGVGASRAGVVRLGKVVVQLGKVKGGTEDMGGDGAMGLNDRGSRGEAHASNGVAETAETAGGGGKGGGHCWLLVGCGLGYFEK
jgi:hypothetical protein